jgi:hypothetical protein
LSERLPIAIVGPTSEAAVVGTRQPSA